MTTNEAKQQLTDDLKTVGRDAKDLMNAAAGKAGEKVSQMRSQMQSRLDSALQSTRETAERAQAKAASAAKATDQCIRDHPYETVGVFLGLGILVGFLIARR